MKEKLDRATGKFKELEEYTSNHVEKLMAQGLQDLVAALAELDRRLQRIENDGPG